MQHRWAVNGVLPGEDGCHGPFRFLKASTLGILGVENLVGVGLNVKNQLLGHCCAA